TGSGRGIRTCTPHSGASVHDTIDLAFGVRRRCAALPAADAAATAVVVSLRRPRLGAVRRDLRAAVVRDHSRRESPARTLSAGDLCSYPGGGPGARALAPARP